MAITLTWPAPISAQAAGNEWQCLTQSMAGDARARSRFIAAASDAANRFLIPAAVMVALKQTESGNSLDPSVLNHNTNGTVDRGYFQINVDTWLPALRELGAPVTEAAMHNVRTNALVAAWVLRKELEGRTLLEGVGRYHKGSGTDARSRRIRQVYVKRFSQKFASLQRQCRST
ncbi:lytic transglycosylase domain-containing protein [Halomonas elongata]|uniref:lytic transglycosylase domain-containing protein n=1 Tax=Halomonas elongata TaxID=2746 RepID=UPI00255B0395|nr:lytic transglycosylase domain-containing protein [Halomonas elongata]MDL4860743.1 lytic transglycosylase domain-containing protein [Halomonas elongata]